MKPSDKLTNLICYGGLGGGITAASLSILGLILIVGQTAYKEYTFKKAEIDAKTAAKVYYEPPQEHEVHMTPQRAEMYQKMQKAYEEAMREHKSYNPDRDPYLHLTRNK